MEIGIEHSRKEAGKIILLIGCMFSKKTTRAFEIIERLCLGKNAEEFVILKWNHDVRGKETEGTKKTKGTIETHGGLTKKCWRISNELIVDGKIPKKLFELIKKPRIVFIDEGHFFKDLVKFCQTLANEYGKLVIVAALDGNFKMGPFKEVIELIPKCEKVKKLSATCMDCSKKASFTCKLSNSDKIIEVGGEGLYIPLCRFCYNYREAQKQRQ